LELYDSGFKERFVAFFDILGFSALVNNSTDPVSKHILIKQYQEAIEKAEQEAKETNLWSGTTVKHIWFSDSFIFFSDDGKGNDYGAIITCSQAFIRNMLYLNEPIRGAISYGDFFADVSKKIFVGKALVEAYQESESQNWIGLILSPSATKRARECNLEPLRHSFCKTIIPRKQEIHEKYPDHEDRLVYTFSHGSSNFEPPLINNLEELMKRAKSKHKPKYQNTIEHIRRYHKSI
jgi:hypothetical protein